jgi:hypothetical protein
MSTAEPNGLTPHLPSLRAIEASDPRLLSTPTLAIAERNFTHVVRILPTADVTEGCWRMSRLTDIRCALERALVPLEADVAVAPAGGKVDEQEERFVVRVTVGEESGAAQARLDDLLGTEPGSVRALLKVDPELGGAVSAQRVISHTGWRLFPQADGPPLLGSDVTVLAYL